MSSGAPISCDESSVSPDGAVTRPRGGATVLQVVRPRRAVPSDLLPPSQPVRLVGPGAGLRAALSPQAEALHRAQVSPLVLGSAPLGGGRLVPGRFGSCLMTAVVPPTCRLCPLTVLLCLVVASCGTKLLCGICVLCLRYKVRVNGFHQCFVDGCDFLFGSCILLRQRRVRL